jgi:hypothetical protein
MSDSPIENYLDELFVELRASEPREARAMLNEAEAHLQEAAAEAERRGMTRRAAEAEAVERFGAANQVARADRDRDGTRLITRIAVSGWSLSAVGAIAVGVSGVVAAVMRELGASNEFIAGTRATDHLSATDCARWLAGSPHAHTCAQAALNDWAWETVGYRIAFGVLGALALAALQLARHRSLRLRAWTPLPSAVVDTIATTLFGLAAICLVGLSIDAWISNAGHGAGQWLSAAPVAAAAALLFGSRLVADIRPVVSRR